MEDKTITFTVSKVTNNFGGLFDIKTKTPQGTKCNYTDVGVRQLFKIMEVITEDLNDEGYSVLFEIG